MDLSRDLVKQFAKITNDSNNSKSSDNTVYGEIVEIDGGTYAKIDGSDMVTPVSTTAKVKVGDRVVVTLKNHTATVIGNTTDPSASSASVAEIDGNFARFQTIVTDDLYAKNAKIENLEADYASIGELYADRAEINELVAKYATIETLEAKYASIETLEANYASIYQLEANYATIRDLTAATARIDILDANYATIDDLYATKGEIASLDAVYANIDFANIGQAAFEKIYSEYGLIEDLTIKDGTLTGKLAAVTIDGDLINANTLKADRLIVKGTDGLYYQLNANTSGVTQEQLATEEYQNGLHGSNIIAETITADKISVSDLVAFGATIGGLQIDDGAVYSGVKSSIDNTTTGFYLDKSGQMAVGNAQNFIKYHNNKLEISAENLMLGADKKSVNDIIDDALDDVEIGANNLIRNSINLTFDDYYFSGTLVSTHDGNGNVTISCGASAIAKDDKTIFMRTSASVSDDGAGNVVLG